MRKTIFFAVVFVVALAAHFAGGWVISTSSARVAPPSAAYSIDPSQITLNAHDLPTEAFTDYTVVFN